MRLLSQTELFDDGTVTGDVLLLEIVEKVSSVTDHLQKASSRVMVVVVGAQMLGERVDTGGQNGDLNLGRTGVAFVRMVLFDDLLLNFFLHHGFVPPLHKNNFRRAESDNRCTGQVKDLLNRKACFAVRHISAAQR